MGAAAASMFVNIVSMALALGTGLDPSEKHSFVTLL